MSASRLGDDTLVFIHLPKTGGTALRESLRRSFDSAATALLYGSGDLEGALTREQFDSLSEADRQRLRLVMGHFAFGVHRRIGRPCRYATIVRDPVERVVSLYYHYRNLPGIRFGSRGHRERLRLRWRRLNLEDWVFKEQRVAADNLMVRHLAGGTAESFGRCTEALYERAIENIQDHFIALLVTEQMDLSVDVLSRAIGRPLDPVAALNANPKRPALHEIGPVVIGRIEELNQYDRRLHDFATGRLRGWPT